MNDVVKHKSQRSEAKLTPPCRVAYPYFHERRTKRPNGTPLKAPQNDGVVLVPKLNADPAQCANYAMLAAHCMEAAGKAWPGIGWPAGGHWPIQDGDQPAKPKAPVPGQATPVAKEYPWRKGHWIIEISHRFDPGPRIAVMQGGQAIEIPAKSVAGRTMYKSGDAWIVSLHAWTFQHPEGKFGCNFGFEGALWVGEGEAIGSSGPRSASAMFGGVATFAPATTPSVQQQFGATAAALAPPMPAAPGLAPPAPPAPSASVAAPPLAPAAAAPPAPPMPPAPPVPGTLPAFPTPQ